MSLRIGTMQAGQAEAARARVREVWHGVFDGTPDEHIARHFDDDAVLAEFDDPAASYGERGLLLAAMDGDELVGLGGLAAEDAETAELKRIMLRDGARGQGVGRRLVTALLDHARRQGFRRVRLHTHARLEASRALYESCGFRPIPNDTGMKPGLALHMGLELERPSGEAPSRDP